MKGQRENEEERERERERCLVEAQSTEHGGNPSVFGPCRVYRSGSCGADFIMSLRDMLKQNCGPTGKPICVAGSWL